MNRLPAVESDVAGLAISYANLAIDLARMDYDNAIRILRDQIETIEWRSSRDAEEQKFLYDQDRETRDIVGYSLIALILAIERVEGFIAEKNRIQENQ